MSHYCCKRCGQRYDDCVCSAPNAQLPVVSYVPPQDGKHWDPESRSITAKCLNCRKRYPEHLFNKTGDKLACPDPSQKTTAGPKKLDEARLRQIVKEFWGSNSQVRVMEDTYVEFARLIEKVVNESS